MKQMNMGAQTETSSDGFSPGIDPVGGVPRVFVTTLVLLGPPLSLRGSECSLFANSSHDLHRNCLLVFLRLNGLLMCIYNYCCYTRLKWTHYLQLHLHAPILCV